MKKNKTHKIWTMNEVRILNEVLDKKKKGRYLKHGVRDQLSKQLGRTKDSIHAKMKELKKLREEVS